MATRPEQQHRKTHQQEQQPQERETKTREAPALQQGQDISPDLATELQGSWGNLAITENLEQDHEEHFEESNDVERDKRASSALAAFKSNNAQSATLTEYQYGGDDDSNADPLPNLPGTPLFFFRRGRGNISRLEALRSMGILPELAQSDEILGKQLVLGATKQEQKASPGDSVFYSVLESWSSPGIIAGRSCAPEDLANAPGALDPLGRSIAAAKFLENRVDRAISRSYARLIARAPGSVTSERGGYAFSASSLATIVIASQVADGYQDRTLRDRSVHIALEDDALERILSVAGDISDTVPPASVLYRRVTGQKLIGTAPDWKPSDSAIHWILPALKWVSEQKNIPQIPPLAWPEKLPTLNLQDPADQIDAILLGITDGVPEPKITREMLAPTINGIDAVLAAGGRLQVELAASGLAIRTARFDQHIISTLSLAYHECKNMAITLLEQRSALIRMLGQRVSRKEDRLKELEQEIINSTSKMIGIRDKAMLTLTAIAGIL